MTSRAIARTRTGTSTCKVTACPDTRDDVPPHEVNLRNPSSVAVARDGTVYVADSENGLVRALGPDRDEVHIVAGTVNALLLPNMDNGDGGPATKAVLFLPGALALDPTGRKLHIVERSVGRIRVVDLRRGTIDTVPGDETRGLGNVSDVAVARDGSVYVADLRVCKLDLDDGGCTTVSKIQAMALAIGPDGTLYASDE